MKPKQWFAFIALGLIWSSSFLWIKIAVQEIPPITLVAYRVLFGLLFGVVMILIQRVSLPRDSKVWIPVLVLGITNVAVPFFLISWGEQSINSGVAAILDATVPLFSLVIAHFTLPDDKMTVPKVTGLLIGFAGVIILMSKDIGGSPSSLLGQGAVILACVFYAISGIYARKNTEDTPAVLRSAGPLISATVVMWVGSFLLESPVKVPHLQITWIALLWLGILGSGLAFVLVYYLIHEIGPTRASMVTYTFPLGGVVLGFIFLHESLSWQIILGGVLIIASLAVSNWKQADIPATT
ncbi:MAG: DMT family transporter [Anaerolineales bacterium]|nr:DMT family transporter [Anaerolineales bacterium]